MRDGALSRRIARISELARQFADTMFSTEEPYRLIAAPITIAKSLHQIVKKDNPEASPEVFRVPKTLHARFCEKVLLYREANILLALTDRLKPSPEDSSNRNTLFEPVIWEYQRIIFGELSATADWITRRQSVEDALKDLNTRRHSPMGNIYNVARDWSRKWFADIGFHEMNPEILTGFALLWRNEYITIQKTLEDFVRKRWL